MGSGLRVHLHYYSQYYSKLFDTEIKKAIEVEVIKSNFLLYNFTFEERQNLIRLVNAGEIELAQEIQKGLIEAEKKTIRHRNKKIAAQKNKPKLYSLRRFKY